MRSAAARDKAALPPPTLLSFEQACEPTTESAEDQELDPSGEAQPPCEPTAEATEPGGSLDSELRVVQGNEAQSNRGTGPKARRPDIDPTPRKRTKT